MTDKYLLDGKTPVLCDDLMAWAKRFEALNRIVAQDKIKESQVSTIFLGLDYRFGEGPPLLFQTMVFSGPLDGEQDRYPTWDEAVEGHKAMIEKVIKAQGG